MAVCYENTALLDTVTHSYHVTDIQYWKDDLVGGYR